MYKTMMKIFMALMVMGLMASAAQAGPTVLTKAQLGSVAAGGVMKIDAFVCPVITALAVGDHNPNAVPLGGTGTWTVGPPTITKTHNMMVPAHATNMDGSGVPGGPQSQPGDTDYTAIWAK